GLLVVVVMKEQRKELFGLLRSRAEMPAQRLDGLLIARLEEAAHRERLFVGVVAVACRAQVCAVVGRRQRDHRPRALLRFLEWERRGRLRDAYRHHDRGAIIDDDVLDRLGVAEHAVGAIAGANEAADAQVDVGERGAQGSVAVRCREHAPDFVDWRRDHAFVDERHLVGSLSGAAGAKEHQEQGPHRVVPPCARVGRLYYYTNPAARPTNGTAAGGDGTSTAVAADLGNEETEVAQGLGRMARELPCGDEQHFEQGRTNDSATRRREVLSLQGRPDLGTAADRPRDRRGRFRHDHGSLGLGQVDSARDPGDARRRVLRRILVRRQARAQSERQGTRQAQQRERRLRVPAFSLARRPDGLREPRDPAVVSRRRAQRARGARRRDPRSVPDGRQEGPLSDSALGRPAAASRRGPCRDRAPARRARRRADGQPALEPGRRDHEAPERIERQRHDDHPGVARRARGGVRPPVDRARRRLDQLRQEAREHAVMPTRQPRIFVADDQRDVVESLRLLLKGEGYSAETFGNTESLVGALRERTADAVLMDLNYTRDTTSGDEGLDAVTRIRSFDAHTPIVLMTAWGTINLAVEGMRRGAQDFIEKPWDNERLLAVLRTQVALGRALQRARTLEAENRQLKGAGDSLIAESPAMQPVLETVERVAPTDANVLITGESGCGKGLVARLIHEGSPRRERSLITVNIGSLAETVFESEMFGHVKGAFTDAKNDRVGRFEL